MIVLELDGTTWSVPENWAYTDGEHPGHCRSCDARVLWLANKKSGKKSPFNPDGINHFATCPQASQWRKR